MDDIFELCDLVRETSFALHRYLRHGHLKKVYEHGLLINFGSSKLQVKKYALSQV
jgi:hypothetical protein